MLAQCHFLKTLGIEEALTECDSPEGNATISTHDMLDIMHKSAKKKKLHYHSHSPYY